MALPPDGTAHDGSAAARAGRPVFPYGPILQRKRVGKLLKADIIVIIVVFVERPFSGAADLGKWYRRCNTSSYQTSPAMDITAPVTRNDLTLTSCLDGHLQPVQNATECRNGEIWHTGIL